MYCQVTEVPQKFAGLPLGARAVEIADGATSNYFLKTFGRSPRETVCACDVSLEPSLSQALHLLNGDVVHQKISAGGLIPRWTEEGLSPEEIIERIYIRSLSRAPSELELADLLMKIGEEPDVAALEDVFWAVLNSREFLFQH